MKKPQSGFSLPHLLPLIIAVFLAGGVGYYIYDRNQDKKSVSSQVDQADLIEELPGNLLTIEKIKSLAEAEKPGTNIASLKLEKDGDVLVYILRLSDGTKLVYNAQSGVKLTGAKVEGDETPDDEDLPANFAAALSLADAYEKALAQNPGAKLKEVEIESEDGKIVYEFKFSNGTKVEISAADGSVLKVDREDDEDKKDSSNRGKGSKSSGSNKSDADKDEAEDEDEDRGSGKRGSGGSGGDSGDEDEDDD